MPVPNPELTVIAVSTSESTPQPVTAQEVTIPHYMMTVLKLLNVNNVTTNVPPVKIMNMVVKPVQLTLTDLNSLVIVITISSIMVSLSVNLVTHNVLDVKTDLMNVKPASIQEKMLHTVTVQLEPLTMVLDVKSVPTNVKLVKLNLNNVSFVPLTELMLQTVTVKEVSLMMVLIHYVLNVLIDVTLAPTVDLVPLVMLLE